MGSSPGAGGRCCCVIASLIASPPRGTPRGQASRRARRPVPTSAPTEADRAVHLLHRPRRARGETVLKRNPTHVKHQAPVSHGVISGLAANGIPQVALNAYRVAAARMADVAAVCGIDWALLAGIGREESDHGRFGGAVLHADGVSTPTIIGPALDGKHWDLHPGARRTASRWTATRSTRTRSARCSSSHQTWAIYGTDATGDGRADIFNINDAALGAARYLCAAGGNLRGAGGPDPRGARLQPLRPVPRAGAGPRRRLPARHPDHRHPGRHHEGQAADDHQHRLHPAGEPGRPHRHPASPAKHKKRAPAKSSSATPSRTATTTKAPAPTSGAASSGSTSTGAGGSSGSTSSNPTASPTKSCGPLQHLLHQC